MADAAITVRYEQLRAQTLARGTSGDRQGLALLLREGMASWMTAWASCTPPSIVPPSSPSVLPASVEPTALVAVLASMTLSTLQEHSS